MGDYTAIEELLMSCPEDKSEASFRSQESKDVEYSKN